MKRVLISIADKSASHRGLKSQSYQEGCARPTRYVILICAFLVLGLVIIPAVCKLDTECKVRVMLYTLDVRHRPLLAVPKTYLLR